MSFGRNRNGSTYPTTSGPVRPTGAIVPTPGSPRANPRWPSPPRMATSEGRMGTAEAASVAPNRANHRRALPAHRTPAVRPAATGRARSHQPTPTGFSAAAYPASRPKATASRHRRGVGPSQPFERAMRRRTRGNAATKS